MSAASRYALPVATVAAGALGYYYYTMTEKAAPPAGAGAKKFSSKKMKSKTDLWDKGKGIHGARSKSFSQQIGVYYDTMDANKETVWDMKIQSDKARQNQDAPNPAPSAIGSSGAT